MGGCVLYARLRAFSAYHSCSSYMGSIFHGSFDPKQDPAASLWVKIFKHRKDGEYMEAQLVKRLKRGDLSALEAVIDRYTPYVSAVIRNQLRSFSRREDVEELTADVFTALWKHRTRLTTDHLRSFLGTAARNRARSFLRSLGSPPLDLEDAVLLSDAQAERFSDRTELKAALQTALDALNETDREILLRYYFYGETTAEIAERLSFKAETIKSRLRRGREKLKQKLGGELP